jgi:hypothetical protein
MVFIPLAILGGYWMSMGFAWAVLGAGSWVALNYLLGPQTGFGIALLAQITIFVVRYISIKLKRRSVAEART